MDGFLKEVISPFALICILGVGVGYLIDSKSCSNYSEETGRKTTYRFPGGCFAEHEGKMVYWSEIVTIVSKPVTKDIEESK